MKQCPCKFSGCKHPSILSHTFPILTPEDEQYKRWYEIRISPHGCFGRPIEHTFYCDQLFFGVSRFCFEHMGANAFITFYFLAIKLNRSDCVIPVKDDRIQYETAFDILFELSVVNNANIIPLDIVSH